MKKIKTILFIMVLSTFFVVDNTLFAAFWVENINEGLIWDDQTVDITVQSYIQILLWFLYLLAVLYWLYWGFLIFTAQDDDDKVKDWKKIIIRALLWVVVIFLAWPIVEFIIWQWWWQEWILTE
jgi:NADH:ubiquinone oxidoreductase subunit 5 (subunit L)/multisubunit Na+/H+ antiporter MnhA subunit